MRPALLRLLKRPSAVSVLDSLISTPFGIEHLESRYDCLRCQSRRIQHKAAANDSETDPSALNKLPERQPQAPAGRPFTFRVHDIDCSEEDLKSDYPIAKYSKTCTKVAAEDSASRLGLQPEKLEYESDVGHANDLGERLVDTPTFRHDFGLWEELLRYRQRHYGDRGTLDIWEGLLRRVDPVQFPVHGERADLFWRSFVAIGLKREVFMEELAQYASDLWTKTNRRWGNLYESVVGGFLDRGMVQQAVEWHKKLQHSHLAEPNDVLCLLKPAVSLATHRMGNESGVSMISQRLSVSPGIRAFQNICQTIEGHQIYSTVISTLLQHGRAEEALSMHLYFVERNDHPRTYEEVQPLFEYFKEFGPPHYVQKLRSYIGHRFGIKPDTVNGSAATKKPKSKSKDRSWPKEKPFKDDFGARLFATDALNFDMILAGLRMFGVAAIGPQSLREMAVRAHGTQDILDKLRILQEANISCGNTVFARLVRKLAAENRDILLSDLLRSDQHPEVLEDAPMQESLLVSYYITRDWRQYNLALAVLGEHSEEGPEMFNVHFRKHVAAGEWAFASKVMDQMTLNRKPLSKASLNFMVEQVLTPRRKGVRPVVGPHVRPIEEVMFVLRVLQRAVPMGAIAPIELWVEILKRLGMENRWDELRDCCLWLARHYSSSAKPTGVPWTVSSPPNKSQAQKATPSLTRGTRILETIFNKHLQTAIVAWGFRMRISPRLDSKVYNPRGVEGENLVPWVRGLVLLRELEENGVPLLVNTIRRASRHRLATLFSLPRLSSTHMNRMLRRENPYSMQRVIGDMNRVWGESLFLGLEREDQTQLANPRSSILSWRQSHRLLVPKHRRRFVRTK